MYKTRTFPILKRLIPSLKKRAVKLVWPGGQGVVRREGALFLLNLKYTCDRFILTDGVDEPEQRKYFFDHMRARGCDMFIDIGANIGTYTVFAALNTDCKDILAFEPNPHCYDRLRTQLMLNDIAGKTVTRMAAVSNKNGEVSFEIDPRGNHLFSKVSDAKSNVTVPSVRLDDEAPISGRKIALKIDVEGHETNVLEGMKALLRNNDCFLQIESWPQNAERFIDAMKAEGYACLHRIDEDYYFAKK
jgi:FkbM family methyltransferase